MPWITGSCQRCGENINTSTNLVCGACQLRPPPFTHCHVLWNYAIPINFFITQLKFHQQLVMARMMGHYLAELLHTHYLTHRLPEAIIPIPLHRKRLQERGFNQALEIAKPIAKKLNLRLLRHAAFRIKATQPQSGLNKKQRKENIQQAFNISKNFNAKHVLVVDDVITTSNTMTEFCNTLLNAKVARIEVACAAKRMRDKV